MRFMNMFTVCFAAVFFASAAWAAVEPEIAASVGAEVLIGDAEYFARVNGEILAPEEYAIALRKAVQDRYYHGQIAQAELVEFRAAVADALVVSALVAQEARKRGMKPDATDLKKQLSDIEQRFAALPEWAAARGKVMAIYRARYERESLVSQMEKKVRDVPVPSEAALKDFYQKNKDKFTTPEKYSVSIIMLGVDSSSPGSAWEAARKEADALVAQLRHGAKFEELARIHSNDPSASKGGDMGYIHLGMLAMPAQNVLTLMEVGDISEPVVLLQGVAIFRVNARQAAALNPLTKVRERAIGLLQREQGDKAWASMTAVLRKAATIDVNTALLKLPPTRAGSGR